MAENCCNGTQMNLGTPSCLPSMSRTQRAIFVNYYDENGDVNQIASSDTIDSTYVNDRINAGNYGSSLTLSQRWYFTDTINSVEDVRAENVTQDIDGMPYSVKAGIRNFKGTFYGSIATPKLVKALKGMACKQMGVFYVNVDGSLDGAEYIDGSGDKYLRPYKIQRNTLQAIPNKASATEVAKVDLMYVIAETEDDGDIETISASDITADLLTVKSVIDVVGESSSPSTTGFVLDLTYIFGSVFNKFAFKNAVLADFAVYNTTTSSSITLTSVTESPDGTYTFVMPVQTSADVLTVDLSKDGFEMSTVTVTIP